MRVIVIGPDYPDAFATEISLELQALGHQAVVVPPSRIPPTLKRRELRFLAQLAESGVVRNDRLRQRLLDRPVDGVLSTVQPDLVVSVMGSLPARRVLHWRRRSPSAKWALWYPDAMVNLGRQECLEADYDLLCFKDPFLVDHLRTRAGLPAYFLPEGARTTYPCDWDELPSASEAEEHHCDVVVLGNLYPYRERILEQLPPDIDVRIHGHVRSATRPKLRAAYSGRYVTGRDKVLAYRGAVAVLNTLHFGEVRSVNFRLFEAARAGAFILSHDSPDMAQYFEPGAEVVTFESPRELAEQVRHYRGRPEERLKIGEAALARTLSEHTYAHRLTELLRMVGLGTSIGPRVHTMIDSPTASLADSV